MRHDDRPPRVIPKKVRGPGSRQDPSTERAVPGLHPNRVPLPDRGAPRATVGQLRGLVHGLPMQLQVEPLALGLLAHAQSDDDVDQLEQD
jgi:hypothetical protein